MPATTTIGSALSLAPDTGSAIEEAWRNAVPALRGETPSLVAIFASAHHAPQADAIAGAVAVGAPDAAVLGCCAADGVIQSGRELERGPALAVWLARFPDGARVEAFHVVAREGAHGELELRGGPDLAGGRAAVLAIADPYTVPVDAVVGLLDGVPVIGGLAGLGAPGEARLFTTGGVVREGLVGVSLAGVPLVPLVSQGARPIGPELVVTGADGNAILGLAGQPALQKLRQVLEELDPSERTLALTGLMLGRVIEENRADHGVGDFLVRGLVGVDHGREALLVADHPRVGQLVRFHARDERSADEELRHVLGRAAGPAAGALLFSCNGRGTRLFSDADHDAGLVQRALGDLPVAGMFCQGELGPVGGRTFLHGFTATLALFPRA